MRNEIPYQINEDAEIVYKTLEKSGGSLPFTDKSDKELIKAKFGMSKNAYKRAVGHLFKEGKIEITDEGIHIKDQ